MEKWRVTAEVLDHLRRDRLGNRMCHACVRERFGDILMTSDASRRIDVARVLLRRRGRGRAVEEVSTQERDASCHD